VAIDGKPIVRQAQLKHALGPRYAGETVRVEVERGKERKRLSFDVKLAATIEPYAHPFLGVLPETFSLEPSKNGILIRYVYPDSPAQQAGVKPGDRLIRIGDQPTPTLDRALEALMAFEPGATVSIEWRRGEAVGKARIKLAALPESVPNDLPPRAKPGATQDAEAPTGIVEVDIPEEPNDCWALVPETYRAGIPHGVLIWLAHTDESWDEASWKTTWGPVARAHRLIVVAPQPAEEGRWSPTEAAFLEKIVDELARTYEIDRHRVVVGGRQSGAALAWITAFRARQTFRGVVMLNGFPPRGGNLPANEPNQRLAVFLLQVPGSRLSRIGQSMAEALRKARYPVTERDVGGTFDEKTRRAVGEWIEVLPRF
ncbi:MAG TPA: PDZ domain-containing protein, partial [Planctomycetaceae bacterium]|nr:PDZ domain-containing protein [Planctomycetaceae bacterium]